MSDRVMAVLERFVAGYAGVAARSRIREIAEVDRELRLEVTAADLLASDVMGVTIAGAAGEELPEWHPGGHIDLVLPSGTQRQYSLCGDPADRSSYRIAVRRLHEGGGGSIEVHELTEGTAVTVRGPRNAFPFAYPHLAKHSIRDVAFIAGGIGITALLPMVRAAAAAGVPWSLTYVGRDEGAMPFLVELRAIVGGHVRVLHGRPSPEDVLTAVGSGTSVYFCGPSPFLHTIREALADRPHEGFHFERFTPPETVDGRSFRIRLARSGHDIEVPADRSALAAIRDVRPDVPYSCQQGFCGTCRVDVLRGKPDQRGTASFLDQPGTMLVCVDRSDDPNLTIDL